MSFECSGEGREMGVEVSLICVGECGWVVVGLVEEWRFGWGGGRGRSV